MFVIIIAGWGGTGGVREGAVQCEGARACWKEAGIHDFFFFFFLVMTHKSAEDTCLSSVERVRVVGFQEASIGNIKSQSVNKRWREWLNSNSSAQTESSPLRQTISVWPVVWDQWKIHLSHLDNVRQTWCKDSTVYYVLTFTCCSFIIITDRRAQGTLHIITWRVRRKVAKLKPVLINICILTLIVKGLLIVPDFIRISTQLCSCVGLSSSFSSLC